MNQEKRQETKSFYVDVFRPEDARGIVSLFRAVYGEGYPIRLFYDPQAIIDANRDGRYSSVVARTDSGEVIAVNHLFHSAPCPKLYETGVGLVLKEYRNAGANKKTLSYLYEEYVPRQTHIEELFGEAVCNHVFMQKTIDAFRFVETAIEVALMPAETYTQEKSAPDRVATLDAFRCYVRHPHRIYLPSVYETILRRIYGRLDDTRDLAPAGDAVPPDKKTRAELSTFDFAGVARIAVFESGNDVAACLADLEKRAQAKNVLVFQVWLNLTEPHVGKAVDILREAGYFFGGALPRWFDGDGLLMQKVDCPPNFDNIVLWSDFAKELLDFIRKDRDLVLRRPI